MSQNSSAVETINMLGQLLSEDKLTELDAYFAGKNNDYLYALFVEAIKENKGTDMLLAPLLVWSMGVLMQRGQVEKISGMKQKTASMAGLLVGNGIRDSDAFVEGFDDLFTNVLQHMIKEIDLSEEEQNVLRVAFYVGVNNANEMVYVKAKSFGIIDNLFLPIQNIIDFSNAVQNITLASLEPIVQDFVKDNLATNAIILHDLLSLGVLDDEEIAGLTHIRNTTSELMGESALAGFYHALIHGEDMSQYVAAHSTDEEAEALINAYKILETKLPSQDTSYNM